MEKKICQSCGMPLNSADELGSNRDGSKNTDYCVYCFQNGEFTQDVSMDEMIAHCAQFVDDFNKDSEHKYTKDEAISQMRLFFPNLKRWKL